MGTMGKGDYDLERLKAEIAQEKQMKEMLEQSLRELQTTVDELEKRADGLGEENNEWKTRYETQCEINQQLEKQGVLYQDKLLDAKSTLKENQMPRSVRPQDAAQETNPQYVISLEREKATLSGQLRDLEWRLDQESKAYHKANEERKSYMTELQAAKGAVEYLKRQAAYNNTAPASDMYDSIHTSRSTPRGDIPDDQRVIDPRMGPIRKTAGVKNLPHLD